MIVRFEPWGAWVKLETEAALVALDQDGVRALGLDGGAAWAGGPAGPPRPVEVHVAVTSRCAVGCEGCYLDARPDGETPARGMTPVVTTSGVGVGVRGADTKKLDALARFAQVNVSFEGPAAGLRGADAGGAAARVVEALAARGVRVGVNVVLTREAWPELESTLRLARALGAREAQLLRYKPAGRARGLDYLARRLTPAQAAELGPRLRALAEALPDMRLRIDCALVPMLSADPDLAARPEELARWGVFGCEAGRALEAVRVDGAKLPCSFASEGGEARLAAFRALPDDPPEPCASCTLRATCRGGCRIVAEHVDGAIGPDPECPRVRAWRAS